MMIGTTFAALFRLLTGLFIHHHIMLGSDYPQFTLRQTVDALESLDLERSEKDKILYETARKLLTPKVPD
jgi:predicted TIM-barrel fold metal-dependent hydrolase